MIAVPWHRPPRYQPPEPNVVRLVPPPTDPELPVPQIGEPIRYDHETEEELRLGPLAAYRLVAWSMGPDFASRWADWTAARRRAVRLEEFMRWQDEHE